MTVVASLVELLRRAFLEPSERAAFVSDPAGVLRSAGFGDAAPQDVLDSAAEASASLPDADRLEVLAAVDASVEGAWGSVGASTSVGASAADGAVAVEGEAHLDTPVYDVSAEVEGEVRADGSGVAAGGSAHVSDRWAGQGVTQETSLDAEVSGSAGADGVAGSGSLEGSVGYEVGGYDVGGTSAGASGAAALGPDGAEASWTTGGELTGPAGAHAGTSQDSRAHVDGQGAAIDQTLEADAGVLGADAGVTSHGSVEVAYGAGHVEGSAELETEASVDAWGAEVSAGSRTAAEGSISTDGASASGSTETSLSAGGEEIEFGTGARVEAGTGGFSVSQSYEAGPVDVTVGIDSREVEQAVAGAADQVETGYGAAEDAAGDAYDSAEDAVGDAGDAVSGAADDVANSDANPGNWV